MPCIEHFIWNEWRKHDPAAQNEDVRARGWTWCDMMFTAFLINKLDYAYPAGSHELHMKHLRKWFEALNSNLITLEMNFTLEELTHNFEVSPRVVIAEQILDELKHSLLLSRGQARSLPWFFQNAEQYNKPYRLFCLCLSFIVCEDCEELLELQDTWRSQVVCRWEDTDYAELDRGFVHGAAVSSDFIRRAENFFQKTVGVNLLKKYAGLLEEEEEHVPEEDVLMQGLRQALRQGLRLGQENHYLVHNAMPKMPAPRGILACGAASRAFPKRPHARWVHEHVEAEAAALEAAAAQAAAQAAHSVVAPPEPGFTWRLTVPVRENMTDAPPGTWGRGEVMQLRRALQDWDLYEPSGPVRFVWQPGMLNSGGPEILDLAEDILDF